MGSFIWFLPKIGIFENLETPSSNFPKFSKCPLALQKSIFRCLQFLGKVRITTDLNSSIANAMRTFPKKYKHLNIVLRTFQSRIRNWKRAFRKFGKFEERSSKFLEIRKLELISNEWTQWINLSFEKLVWKLSALKRHSVSVISTARGN